jgi:hypothetical protein
MTEHLFRIAAHAYAAGEMDAGRRACERLARTRLEPGMEAIVRRNRTWYTQLLGDLLDVRMQQVQCEPFRSGWSLFNPSVVRKGCWTVNVRSSNYRIIDGQYVMPPEDSGIIRTGNVLCRINDDLAIEHSAPWACDYEKTEYAVDGFEDVRLNVVDGECVVSATVRNMAPHDGTCRIATAQLRRGALVGLACPATADGHHEKNWMPILGRREWLYACSVNGRTATVRLEDGAWRVTHHAEAPHVAAQFRGGSQLVPIDNGRWLAIVHEVAEDAGRRIYEHRFVTFNEADGWRMESISQPFAFREQRAIEFCAGLARNGKTLAATFGVRDAEAWIATFDLTDAVNLTRDAWA